jgi:hypothetical protein
VSDEAARADEAQILEELVELFAVSLRESLDATFTAWLQASGGKPGAEEGFSRGFGEFVVRVLGFVEAASHDPEGAARWRQAWWAKVEQEIVRGLPEARARLERLRDVRRQARGQP